MLTLTAVCDRVEMKLANREADILIAPERAIGLADACVFQARLAEASQKNGPREALPEIDIESVLAGGSPMVRIKFGRRVRSVYLPPKVARQFGLLLRAAANDAQAKAPAG